MAQDRDHRRSLSRASIAGVIVSYGVLSYAQGTVSGRPFLNITSTLFAIVCGLLVALTAELLIRLTRHVLLATVLASSLLGSMSMGLTWWVLLRTPGAFRRWNEPLLLGAVLAGSALAYGLARLAFPKAWSISVRKEDPQS